MPKIQATCYKTMLKEAAAASADLSPTFLVGLTSGQVWGRRLPLLETPLSVDAGTATGET